MLNGGTYALKLACTNVLLGATVVSHEPSLISVAQRGGDGFVQKTSLTVPVPKKELLTVGVLAV